MVKYFYTREERMEIFLNEKLPEMLKCAAVGIAGFLLFLGVAVLALT